jgi:hypothetical protein
VSFSRYPRRPVWPAKPRREPEPLPPSTVSDERAREIAQSYLSREHSGLFALPPVLGALRGREVWFVQVGRLGAHGVVGELVVDAATGAISDVRLDD